MTLNCQGLTYDFDGIVARITLDDPDMLNALTTDMLLAMPEMIAQGSAEARALLITGQGRAFCSGAKLGSDKTGERDLGTVIDTLYNPLANALSDSRIPIVTAMNGLAAGAGVGLALGADIVIAARSSYLLLAFAKIGLVPDAGSTWLIAQSIGRARTLEMALLADRIPAETACANGLITRVVDDENVLEEAELVARKLAAMPTEALALIRRQVRVALDQGFTASLAAERTNQRLAGYTEDHREGVSAFREKRAPNFTGK